MSKFAIYVGSQHGGATFQVDPLGRQWLKENGWTQGVKSLFVAKEANNNFLQDWESMLPQIVSLLTGLSPDALEELGTVVFMEPKDDSVLASIEFGTRDLQNHG